MVHNSFQLTRAAAIITFCGLVVVSGIVVFAIASKQIVGLPIVLLLLFGWGSMFVFQVVMPIIAVIQVLAWLSRKLFAQA